MPSLVEMQRRLESKGITVVAVSVDIDQGAYNQFIRDHNVTLLTVRDSAQKSNINDQNPLKVNEYNGNLSPTEVFHRRVEQSCATLRH